MTMPRLGLRRAIAIGAVALVAAACGGGSSGPDYRNVATLEAAVRAHAQQQVAQQIARDPTLAETNLSVGAVQCTSKDETRLHYSCSVDFNSIVYSQPTHSSEDVTVTSDGSSWSVTS
jgi:hypothetical protein